MNSTPANEIDSAPPPSGRGSGSGRRWPLVVLGVIVLLLVLWSAVGFWLIPELIRRELPRVAEEQLHHRARIGEVRFNPFTLRLRAGEFTLEDNGGQRVLGFGSADIDVAWSSLPRRGLVLSDVRLTQPFVNVVVDKDGKLNLASLAPPAAPGKPEQPAGGPPRFDIAHVEIDRGRIGFEDRRGGYRNSLDDLALKLQNLTTLDKEKGDYSLSAQTPGGAKLRWKGDLTLNPLVASGILSLDGIALPELKPYLAQLTQVNLASGKAQAELPYKLELPGGEPRFSLAGARLAVHDLSLAGPTGAPLASAGQIALEGVDFAFKDKRLGAKSLLLADLKVSVARDAAGTLDVVQWLAAPGGAAASSNATPNNAASAGKPSAGNPSAGDTKSARGDAKPAQARTAGAADAAPWDVNIAAVEVRNAAASYRDATAKTPLAAGVEGLGLRAGLRIKSGAAGAQVNLEGGEAQATRIALWPQAASAADAPLAVSDVAVGGLSYDGAALGIERVRVGSVKVGAKLRDGQVDLLSLLPVFKSDPASKPLAVTVGAVELADGSVTVGDADHRVDLALDHLTAKATGVVPDRAKPLGFELAAQLRSGGRLAVHGGFVPASSVLDATLDIKGLTLAPLQPLISSYARVKLASGEAALAGTLKGSLASGAAGQAADGEADAPAGDTAAAPAPAGRAGRERGNRGNQGLVYRGSAAVSNLVLNDEQGAKVAAWQSLSAESLRLRLSPLRLTVDELRFSEPYARFALAKDGTSNISRLLVKSDAAATPSSSASTSAAPAAAPPAANQPAANAPTAPPTTNAPTTSAPTTSAPPAAGSDANAPPPLALTVRRLSVAKGRLEFSDASIDPGFNADITNLNGTANGLSNAADTRSQFALEGAVGEFGFARLSGALNLYSPRDRTNFRVEFRNIDMTSVTPYSMRFAGYRIASGRMNLDLNYRLRGAVIEGDNRIVLNSFTLGEKVESPSALNLPLDLAIALLKEPDGSINVELPVSGNLDDPQFSFAPLIWKAVGNLVRAVITAPFRMLGRLFGGGEDEQAGSLQFEAGNSRLLPPEREKLVKLATLMEKRPQLKLEIPVRADEAVDGRALRRQALSSEVLRRAGVAPANDDEATGPINVDDRRTRAALRALYSERFSSAEYDKRVAEAAAKEKDSAKDKEKQSAKDDAKSGAAENSAPSLGLLDRARKLVAGEPQLADPRPFYTDLVRRLREAQPLPPDALAKLGSARAAAVAEALRAAGVAADRVAELPATSTGGSAPASTGTARSDADRYVRLDLSLAAR